MSYFTGIGLDDGYTKEDRIEAINALIKLLAKEREELENEVDEEKFLTEPIDK